MKEKSAQDLEMNVIAEDEGLANPKTKNEETLAQLSLSACVLSLEHLQRNYQW